MQGIVCDGCGVGLLIDSSVRYVVKIEAYAAYDPMELTRSDLEAAGPDAYAKLVRELEEGDPEQLEREVYARFDYDLCPGCHRRYLEDPLGFSRRLSGDEGTEKED